MPYRSGISLLLLAIGLLLHAQVPARFAAPVSPAMEASVDGRTVKLRLESSSSQWETNAAWPKAEQRGVASISGPGGTALRITTGYAIYDGIVPAGSGEAWTVACWVRPDEPDWGIWQVPWNSQRDPNTMYRFIQPTLLHFGTFLSHLWEIRLCRNKLLLRFGDWTAAGTTPLPVGRWTHVALARDGESLLVFVDGKPEILTQPDRVDGRTGTLLPTSPEPLPPFAAAKVSFHLSDGGARAGRFPVLVLGHSHDSGHYSNKFIGAIGPVIIENRAWGAEEVAAAVAKDRAAADKLAMCYSVLDDPVGGFSRRPDKVAETSSQYLQRMGWFRQAKYGLFLHWNPSSVAKTEISWGRGQDISAEDYDKLYTRFNPTLYNPARWAADAKSGGLHYMVWTVKHHDGFLMWPSATSSYTIAATPYGQDTVARYVQALRKAKMPVGLYYSPRDWWWKANRAELIGPKETKEQLPAYVAAHLKELSNRYGPIDIFWFDGGVGQEAAMYKEILGPLNPRGITNDRNGPGDYITPEGQIPIRPLVNPDGSDAIWESCIPMGNGGWSYRHDGAEAYDVLIHQMVEVFAKGGNLLRNIGPKPTGEWSGPVRERIQQIGAWLKVNGASVYGTHRTRLGAQPWGWATANDTTLYLHVFTWPKDGVLTVTGLHDRVTGVRLLTAGTRLQYQHNGNTLTITLPAEAPDPVDTVIAVRVKR